MLEIDQTLKKFVAILDSHPGKSSHNRMPSNLESVVNKLFRAQEEEWHVSLGKTFCELLDRLEKKPVVFGKNVDEVANQNANLSSYLKVASAVKKMLRLSKSSAHGQLYDLKRRVVGLEYRIEAANGGLARSHIDPVLEASIQNLAVLWKSKQKLYVDKTLTERDKRKIAEVCSYPKFAYLLLRDKELCKTFFIWALRDNGGVGQFVEFPATATRIKAVLLTSRVGRIGENVLRIEKRERASDSKTVQEKILSLPFYTESKVTYINILDESKVVKIYGGWRLTIAKIFDVFANKNNRVGDLEFFESRGIDVWNPHELGRWNEKRQDYDRIDLSQKDWWKALPVLKEETKADLEAKYQVTLAPGQWLGLCKGSRKTPDLDLDGQHGFFEVAIPNEAGNYNIYPFGNFPPVFPLTTLQTINFLANTVASRVSYPDENFFYSYRQIAAYPVIVSPEDGQRWMQSIQKDAMKARTGDIVFQFAGENCAYWAQKTIRVVEDKHPIPKLFTMKLHEARPRNPLLKTLFSWIRKAPMPMQPTLFKGLDICFGSSRGVTVINDDGTREFKSHRNGHGRKNCIMYQPGLLHEQILAGALPGVVSFGH